MNMAVKVAGLIGATLVSLNPLGVARAQTFEIQPIPELLQLQPRNSVPALPEPVITQLPPVPAGAQKSYDPLNVEQLMKMVMLARTLGGGQLGPRAIPLHNDPQDILARGAGPGIKQMTDDALAGRIVGLSDFSTVFAELRSTYGLDQIFAAKDRDEQTFRFIANASAQGGVASATAEESYKRANAGMERLDSYIAAIKGSPDLKTSMDLNTRVMVELTQQVNESLRVQATMTSMMGTYFMMMGGEAGHAASLTDK